MPSPTSDGPNRCPLGETGAEEVGLPTSWICSEFALRYAMELGSINYVDLVDGTYPPDLRSILAFEV